MSILYCVYCEIFSTKCLFMKYLFMKHPIEHRMTILSSAHWFTNKPNQMSTLCVFYELSSIELSKNELSIDEMSVYKTSHRTPQYYSFKWTLSHK